MRILYLSSVRVPSEKASGQAIARQCEGFAKNGHEVTLHVPKRTKTEQSLQEAYGMEHPSFTVHKFASYPLFFLGKPGLFLLYCYETVRVLIFFISSPKFDVIFSRDQYRLAPFILLGYRNRCYAELHTIHSNYFTKLVSKKSKTVVVISQGLKRFYENLSGRSDVLVEPSGVYLNQFNGLSSQSEVRKSFLIPEGLIVFGYVGKFKTIGMSKGVEEIIKSFALSYEQNQNIFLLLVGAENNEMKEFSDMCEAHNIPAHKYKILPLDQSVFANYLVACDVLMMNYPNGEHYAKYMSPIKMFAYLAVGKPIISSDLPTIREIQGVRGIVYAEPDSVESYSNSINTVITKIEFLNQEAVGNIALAKKFSWEARGGRIISG